jgi:hypothetical protein
MATGKTNARWCRLLVDSLNISGDSRQVGSIGVTYQTQDVTGYNDGVHNFTLGRQDFIFSGYQAIFDNTPSGSHIEFSALEEYVMSFFIGIKAAPAAGDPVILQTLEQVSYTVSGSDAVLIDAEFGKSTNNLSTVKAFGEALEIGTSRTGTWDGTSVRTASQAATTNGARANLHVVNIFGGAYTFKVQDSANNSDWTDIITFSADGLSLEAETAVQAAGQTCDQYLRFNATVGTGTGAVWCSLARQ